MFDYSRLDFVMLLIVFVVSLFILVKSSDRLVDYAVTVSRQLNVSEVIIGATIVSLGTTLPELSSSVVSILNGISQFALGNAVGSVITNITLILGLGSLFGSLPVRKESMKRSMFLFILGALLLIVSFCGKIFHGDYIIPQWFGIILVLLIPIYLVYSFKNKSDISQPHSTQIDIKKLMENILLIILCALAVAFSSSALVETSTQIATRIGISELIISSTIVALGTSLPELSTVIASVKKGAGAIAVGNVIGANILNIILVLGVSLLLSPQGISIATSFMMVQFPFLLLTTGFFMYLVVNTKRHEVVKREGFFLLLLYIAYIILSLIV